MDGAEPNRNVEVNVQQLASFLVIFHVVKGHHSLIKFEKVNPVLRLLLPLRISWQETFHSVHVINWSLHNVLGLLLDEEVVNRPPRMNRRARSSAKLNIRLKTVGALSKPKIATSLLTVLSPVVEIHSSLAMGQTLMLVTHRVKVVRSLVALRILHTHLKLLFQGVAAAGCILAEATGMLALFLLQDHPMKLDVTVVHYEVLG